MSFSEIVTKINQTLNPKHLKASDFEKPRPGQPVAIEVNLIAEPEYDSMKKKALVLPNVPGWGAFEIWCDEGTAIGGEDKAPPPLSYFAVGVAFCLLTHLMLFIKKKNYNVEKVVVEQSMKFSRAIPTDIDITKNPQGGCELLETHLIIESSESRDKIKELALMAKQSCMATQAVINVTPEFTKVYLNGETIQ